MRPLPRMSTPPTAGVSAFEDRVFASVRAQGLQGCPAIALELSHVPQGIYLDQIRERFERPTPSYNRPRGTRRVSPAQLALIEPQMAAFVVGSAGAEP
jgi:hypothetical protein